jgi:tetratricopeptide (TPR) repeat protein
MKKSVLLLLVIVCLSGSNSISYGQSSFKRDFREALNAGNTAEAEKILEAWDYAEANNPELYVAYFNFYTVKSMEKDSTGYDMEYVRQALDYISNGIEFFPTRFDMRIGKIYMLLRLEDYKSVTDEVIKLINYSKEINNEWKGEEYRLVENPAEMLNGAVQEFQGVLFSKKDSSLYDDIIKISKEMIKCYPTHSQSLLNISTVYILRKDYDQSLDLLQKAVQMRPKNAVYQYNLAYVYEMKGDKENAGKHYKLTTECATEKEQKLKEGAQKRLDALK